MDKTELAWMKRTAAKHDEKTTRRTEKAERFFGDLIDLGYITIEQRDPAFAGVDVRELAHQWNTTHPAATIEYWDLCEESGITYGLEIEDYCMYSVGLTEEEKKVVDEVATAHGRNAYNVELYARVSLYIEDLPAYHRTTEEVRKATETELQWCAD